MADSNARLNVLIALKSVVQDQSATEFLKKFTAGLLATGGAMAALGAQQAISLGGKITDLASQAQLGTQAFQALALVGSESGVAMENVAAAAEKLRRNLQEARDNAANPLNASLRALNLSAVGLQALAPERQWEEIARALATATDRQAALNAASDLFGAKNLFKFQELLQRLGNEGYDKIFEATEKLRVSDANLKTLDDAGDKLTHIKNTLLAIAAKGTASVLGGISEAFERVKREELARAAARGDNLPENNNRVAAEGRALEIAARAEDRKKAQADKAAQERREQMAAAETQEREFAEALARGLAQSTAAREVENLHAEEAIRLQRESDAVFRATRSARDDYNESLQRAGALLGHNLLTQETYNRAVDAANTKLAATTTLPAAEAQLRATALDIATRQIALQSDYTRTAADTWAERRALLLEEIAAQEKLLATQNALRDAAATPESRAQFAAQGAGTQDRLGGLQGQVGALGADPNDAVAQAKQGLRSLRESWGTTAQQIGNTISRTIGSALDAVNESLTGLILGTETWGSALMNIGRTMVTEIVTGIIRMFTTWVVQRGIAAVASMAWSAKEGAADAAAKLPGAAATSISSYGIAAALGIAALVAAMAAFGGFEEGGHTGAGGVVHAGEWVAPSWMVTSPELGGVIAGLESARTGGLGSAALSPAAVGAGGGEAGAMKEPRVLLVDHRDHDAIGRLLADPRFETKVRHVGRRHPGDFGSPT